jgi:hypothetical protein
MNPAGVRPNVTQVGGRLNLLYRKNSEHTAYAAQQQVAVAAALASQALLYPGCSIKPMTETRNSTTTFADDSFFAFPLPANSRFAITLKMFYTTGAVPGIKWRIHLEGGDVQLWRLHHWYIGIGNNAIGAANMDVEFDTGGFISVQWAQAISNGADTTIFGGSHVVYMVLPAE